MPQIIKTSKHMNCMHDNFSKGTRKLVSDSLIKLSIGDVLSRVSEGQWRNFELSMMKTNKNDWIYESIQDLLI